jgi:hypothetical protein
LQALRKSVTTRPHLWEELDDKLQQISYTKETFSEENKVEFLKKFCYQNECFTEVKLGRKNNSKRS